MNKEVLNYKGIDITFLTGDNLMVNATEMIKAFPNKRMSDFTRSQSTQDYIAALANDINACKSTDTQKSVSALTQTVKGGNDKNAQGTYMHEDLALYFAQWLSPEFHIWCNRKIKDLLRDGYVGVTDMHTAVIAEALNPEMEYLNAIVGMQRKGIEIGKRLMKYTREIDYDMDRLLIMYKGIYKGCWRSEDKEHLLRILESNINDTRNEACMALSAAMKFQEAAALDTAVNAKIKLWISDTRERLLKTRLTIAEKALNVDRTLSEPMQSIELEKESQEPITNDNETNINDTKEIWGLFPGL